MPDSNGHFINTRKGLFRESPRPITPVRDAAGELFQIDPPRTSDEFTTRALAAHLKWRACRNGASSAVDVAAAEAKAAELKAADAKREADRKAAEAKAAADNAAHEERRAKEAIARAAEARAALERKAEEKKAAEAAVKSKRPVETGYDQAADAPKKGV